MRASFYSPVEINHHLFRFRHSLLSLTPPFSGGTLENNYNLDEKRKASPSGKRLKNIFFSKEEADSSFSLLRCRKKKLFTNPANLTVVNKRKELQPEKHSHILQRKHSLSFNTSSHSWRLWDSAGLKERSHFWLTLFKTAGAKEYFQQLTTKCNCHT